MGTFVGDKKRARILRALCGFRLGKGVMPAAHQDCHLFDLGSGTTR
jgi:hypothetical protein